MQRTTRQNMDRKGKAGRLLARVRARQLSLAMTGRVVDSARYADRAVRIRRALRDAA